MQTGIVESQKYLSNESFVLKECKQYHNFPALNANTS